ncbi:MAG TPA: PAS domain S-box protein, partial [Labilithrix sp.]|nr:PAS domain S-box protein [Labilithrix sp.]
GFDGYLKRVNPSWTRTLGWTAEELMSRPSLEFVHPEDRAAVLAARGRLFDGIPLATLVNRYRCRDGKYRWLEWRSVPDVDRKLVYAAARDVTEQREAQRALRELTENLTTTLNSIADGVIATYADGAVARMNPVAERLTGWSSAEAVGTPLRRVFDVVDADTRASAALPLERTLEEGIAVDIASHLLLVARDGTKLPIASSCAPMRGADGSVSGVVLVFRDMSAEKKAKEAHERLQQQLILADRMASVGTLAAGVAHEINNPLAYVMSNLDMLISEFRFLATGPLSAHMAEWAEMALDAREGTERIRKIVRGLKTFSRAEEERRAVIDVRPVLELAIDMAFNEVRHRARLVKDYGPMPLVAADDARLGQVFINLLVNAAQALPEGGEGANEIRIVTSTDVEGRAVVEVRDTGPGIPESVIGRVFDPFFTTKPVGIGTGLGLSVCHNIVTSMGGEITARNEAGRGAVFQVVLPAASGGPDDAPRSGACAPSSSASRRATVLVVDDDRSVGVSLGRVLRGHDVTVVTSARAAFDLVVSGKPFDVVLSDLMMPEMSGMDLYDKLARTCPQAAERMVFITGGAFTPAANAFLDRVPNERIDKPFDPALVRQLVEKLVT